MCIHCGGGCLRYEWDPAKAQANLAKHGVNFAGAVAVFEDDLALHRQDLSATDEDRFIVVGMDALGRVVVVVYVHRGDAIRLISARLAEPWERRHYECEP